jgi:excinuclease ABC subunit A
MPNSASNKNRQSLSIRGARQNNLQNIDLDIPKHQLVVITGVSGSGKSSLAFDVIYQEGLRRYLENLSLQGKFFLQDLQKPRVAAIENLSPTLALRQTASNKNPRSTVGTATEIHEILRSLLANFGQPHCPNCEIPLQRTNPNELLEKLKQLPKNSQIAILAPWENGSQRRLEAEPGDRKLEILDKIERAGFTKIYTEEKIYSLQELRENEQWNPRSEIFVLIDKLTHPGKNFDTERIADSLRSALVTSSDNRALALINNQGEIFFSDHFFCSQCDFRLSPLSRRDFSFNNPQGACPTCSGLGKVLSFEEQLLVANYNLSILEGAIAPLSRSLGKLSPRSKLLQTLQAFAEKNNFRLDQPLKKIPPRTLKKLFRHPKGENLTIQGSRGKLEQVTFYGLIPELEARLQQSTNESQKNELKKYARWKTCSLCEGHRLKESFLKVKFAGLTLVEFTGWEIKALLEWAQKTKQANSQKSNRKKDLDRLPAGSQEFLTELTPRLENLVEVGLGYLNLGRSTDSLSGGEFQRLRLASQLRSQLSEVIYILDEPSAGLHPQDTKRLIKTLRKFPAQNNSVLVVEHDSEIIQSADWVIDIGPQGGTKGGKIVFQGAPEKLISKETETARLLQPERAKNFLSQQRKPIAHLTLQKAQRNNLQDLTVKIPLGNLVSITGVSGSGKSTLISDVLAPNLKRLLNQKPLEDCQSLKFSKSSAEISKVIIARQSPIGRSSRSTVATYTGIFDPIRTFFADTPQAKEKSLPASAFSFNMRGGRCEHCQGEGRQKIPMAFMEDVSAPCSVCQGTRYNAKALSVKRQGVNIAQVLEMNLEYAYHFFAFHDLIRQRIKPLLDIGLGYLKLGQAAPELSGGEAQRIKLATELGRKTYGQALFVLDEPTIGLHLSDTARLLKILQALVKEGNSVLLIEHNLDLISASDHVIELGPGGGQDGGQIIFQGSPAQLKKASTPTGKALR